MAERQRRTSSRQGARAAERPRATAGAAPSRGAGERARAELFRPLKIRKAVDEVISVIVDALHSGLIQPGERLPREADMAERPSRSRGTR